MDIVIYNSVLMTIDSGCRFDTVEDAEAALAEMSNTDSLVVASQAEYAKAFELHRERCRVAGENRQGSGGDTERRLNDFECYQSHRKVLQRPTFDSLDDARANMRAKEGEFRRFVVREPLGIYRVYFAFMNTPRGATEPQWACNEEYSFSHAKLQTLKLRAATAVGLDLIDSME